MLRVAAKYDRKSMMNRRTVNPINNLEICYKNKLTKNSLTEDEVMNLRKMMHIKNTRVSAVNNKFNTEPLTEEELMNLREMIHTHKKNYFPDNNSKKNSGRLNQLLDAFGCLFFILFCFFMNCLILIPLTFIIIFISLFAGYDNMIVEEFFNYSELMIDNPFKFFLPGVYFSSMKIISAKRFKIRYLVSMLIFAISWTYLGTQYDRDWNIFYINIKKDVNKICKKIIQ